MTNRDEQAEKIMNEMGDAGIPVKGYTVDSDGEIHMSFRRGLTARELREVWEIAQRYHAEWEWKPKEKADIIDA